MFVFFLLGGRYLEMGARQKALSVTESLAKLLPAFAQKLPNFPGDRQSVQCMVADLSAGDHVLLRPGDIVPADGVVVDGIGAANEALLTGESRLVPKSPGSALTGGAVNADSPLVMCVEQVGAATRLSAIINLMERAANEKPRLVELADRVATYFVASLLVVAGAVAVGWYYVDPAQALWVTVSVLVVTCPCALSLATPIALTVAAGALARDGLLVTRGHAIETLARATHFVFDKTGTLTAGKMALGAVQVQGRLSEDECLRIAAALEGSSGHPIATALSYRASADVPEISDVVATGGAGIEALIDGVRYRIGRPDYVAALAGRGATELPEGWRDCGDTIVSLGDAAGGLAIFRITDSLRAEARPLVQDLLAEGRHVVLLTGDSPAVAQRVARDLGIREVRAGQSPQDKHAYVKNLQAEGAIVAMVGDGVNDAPVLAQAQVSVAMGGGAHLARTQADFVLLSENLAHLRTGWRRAVRSLSVVRQNLWWSFAYNFIALPLAISGHVTPWIAGIGMSASSLLVVLNSLRIQRFQG